MQLSGAAAVRGRGRATAPRAGRLREVLGRPVVAGLAAAVVRSFVRKDL